MLLEGAGTSRQLTVIIFLAVSGCGSRPAVPDDTQETVCTSGVTECWGPWQMLVCSGDGLEWEKVVCGDGNQCRDGGCCYSQCEERTCGPDGCGGNCGECGVDQVCIDGACECAHDVCGDLCCGEGEKCCLEQCCAENEQCCAENETCCAEDETCCVDQCCAADEKCCLEQCVSSDCGEWECGFEPCLEHCGSCDPGSICFFGRCLSADCDDGNNVDWDGCTQGLKGELLVDQVAAGEQTSPSIALCEDDSYVIVWKRRHEDSSSWSLMGRLFAQDGSPVTDAIAMVPEIWKASGHDSLMHLVAGINNSPSVVCGMSGQVQVAWSGVEPGSSDTSGEVFLTGAVLGSSSASSVETVKINEYETGSEAHASLIRVSEGQWFVTWTSCPKAIFDHDAGVDGDGCGVRGRFVGDASATTPEFGVNLLTDGIQAGSRAVLLGSGDVGVFWNGGGLYRGSPGGLDDSGSGVFGRLVPVGLSLTSSECLVNVETSGNQSAVSAVPTQDGRAAVVWTSGADGAFRVFDLVSNNHGPESQLSGYGHWSGPVVSVLDDGGNLVAFAASQSTTMSVEVFLARVDGNGEILSSPLRLNTFLPGDQTSPCLVSHPQFSVVAWQSCPKHAAADLVGQDGDGCGVFSFHLPHAELFSPP